MKSILSKAFWQKGFKILKATFGGFSDDKGVKLSASLAYTTIFSLGPLLLLMMSLASIFFGQAAIEGQIFGQLNGLIGDNAAKQVQDIIQNIQFSGKTRFALIASIVTLIIGATSLFIEIQDSLNTIWKVKAKPKRGWVQFLKNRLLSSSLIVSLGFLLVVSLVINGAVDALGTLLSHYLSSFATVVISGINLAITFVIITFLFGIIFKVLPDAKIKWKDVKTGALFTAILFIFGRFLIGLYIAKSATVSTYGAAGSIIVILVWIYYTSMILYLGAEFTQVYSEAFGRRIEPADYAVYVEQKEVEKEVAVLPVQHPEVKK
ncbi:MAG: YihY/virulence factor BrkB family protein [Chitinophagaceae bacterium]